MSRLDDHFLHKEMQLKKFHWINNYNRYEITLVRKLLAKSKITIHISTFISLLFDGWIYIPIVLILIYDKQDVKIIIPSLIATLIAHLFYRIIKIKISRIRPFDFDPSIKNYLKTLDHYSFPSGHCMTFITISTPLIFTYPKSLLIVLISIIILSWSRLSLGHHYPSDVIFGIIFGLLVSFPICAILLVF